MEKEEGLTYTDDKGNKLFGFSQVSLDENTKATKHHTEVTERMRITVRNSVIALFLGMGWFIYYVIHNNVLNNVLTIVSRCA